MLLSALDAVKVSPLIEKVGDHKDFKKLLRTRTNVLVLYTKTGTVWMYDDLKYNTFHSKIYTFLRFLTRPTQI